MSLGASAWFHEMAHMLAQQRHAGGVYMVRGSHYHYTSPYRVEGKVVNVKIN